MARVAVHDELFRWALDRSGREVESAQEKWPKFAEWLAGELGPTRRQLEEFAKWTRTPFGFFLLDAPPEDRLPIPDFRTLPGEVRRPSPDLLETVQVMQRRQDWLREYLLEEGQEPLSFVGEASLKSSPKAVAESMRNALGLAEDWAGQEKSWGDALRMLRDKIENADIMIVINGLVGNNPHRALEVAEFRGFVLVDSMAPLIFVNGRDAQCAQMFTLAHELAHLWIGEEGVSNLERLQPIGVAVETFCNQVAAEFLVPAHRFQAEWQAVARDTGRFDKLARKFKVSALVVARRALDMGHIARREFFEFYDQQIEAFAERRRQAKAKGGGGDPRHNQRVRIGDLFGGAVAQAVWAGRLLYRDAYKLTGLHGKVFDNYVAGLGT